MYSACGLPFKEVLPEDIMNPSFSITQPTDGFVPVEPKFILACSNARDKKYKSLESTDNILDIELDRALELLAKPTIRGNATLKNLGEHPEEKKDITLHDGKYGPYVKCGKINASLVGDQTIDTISKEEAIILIVKRKNQISKKIKKIKK